MTLVKIYIILTSVFILSFCIRTEAQTCGFGCLGLGGFYAGYNIQKYNPAGLNGYIKAFNETHASTMAQPLPQFGSATGFRVGANLFRTKYNKFLFSAKGYYQFLKEDQQAVEVVSDETITTKYTLNLNYYGVGMDFGYSLGKYLDLKIADAQITFHSADLDILATSSSSDQKESSFSNSSMRVGYQVGSGLVFHLVGDYISLEATAGYASFKFDKLQNTDSVSGDTVEAVSNFIENGGFFGILQLNVGIPLY